MTKAKYNTVFIPVMSDGKLFGLSCLSHFYLYDEILYGSKTPLSYTGSKFVDVLVTHMKEGLELFRKIYRLIITDISIPNMDGSHDFIGEVQSVIAPDQPLPLANCYIASCQDKIYGCFKFSR